MNENKLLACKIKPYTIELDEGQIIKVTNEVWVGYWNRSGEFSAVCWDRIEDGRLVGGDSVTVTKEEFDEKVEKVIDIFGDTESEQYAVENLEHCEEGETDYKRFIEKSGLSITRKEYEEVKLVMEIGEYMQEGIQETVKQAYLKGLERGIGKLRYCCTCKKWHECKVVSMYGICADWEIKE